MSVPREFLIQRFMRPEDDTRIFALIQSFTEIYNQDVRVSFNILPIENKQPFYIKRYQERWNSLEKRIILPTTCVRYDEVEKEKPLELKNSIWFEGIVASVEGRDIPIMNMNKACQILPRIFTNIDKTKYQAYQLFLEYQAPRVCLNPGDEIDTYLKTHEEDVCPITMNPFTKDTVCITPCGHGVTYEAMCKWLETKKACPLCRNHCLKQDLIVLRV